MRNDDHRHTARRKVAHDLEHFADHLRIERACRLVKEHHVGVHAQRAHDGDALLLPAGQTGRIVQRAVFQADAVEQFQRLLLRLLFGKAVQFHRRKSHVPQHGHVREQVELLEHHAHLLAVNVYVYLGVGDVRALKQHLSAGGPVEQVEAAQERRFPGTGRSDHDHDLPFADLRVDAVERADVAEIHLQVFRFNQNVSGHCYAASFPAWKRGRRARRPGSGK